MSSATDLGAIDVEGKDCTPPAVELGSDAASLEGPACL